MPHIQPPYHRCLQRRVPAFTAVVACEGSCGSAISRRRRHLPTLLTSNVADDWLCICWRGSSRVIKCDSHPVLARGGVCVCLVAQGIPLRWALAATRCESRYKRQHTTSPWKAAARWRTSTWTPPMGRRHLLPAARVRPDSGRPEGWLPAEERGDSGGLDDCWTGVGAQMAESERPSRVLLLSRVHLCGTSLLGWLTIYGC